MVEELSTPGSKLHACSNVFGMARPKTIDPKSSARCEVLTLRVSARQRTKLEKLARLRGVSLSEIVRRLVESAPA